MSARTDYSRKARGEGSKRILLIKGVRGVLMGMSGCLCCRREHKAVERKIVRTEGSEEEEGDEEVEEEEEEEGRVAVVALAAVLVAVVVVVMAVILAVVFFSI